MAIRNALHTLRAISKLLVLSYVVDWIFIIGIALIGYAFHTTIPNHHPFALTDASISLPKRPSTVPTGPMVVVALIAPAVFIVLIVLFLVPGSSVPKSTPRSVLLRYKVWEWNAGWMGLALAAASVFMATEGLKRLYGKPRPDMLDRCNPDLSNIAAYAVGGLGQRIAGAPIMVTWKICQNKSDELKVTGFSSFPSGHASFSFAGLTYFSLWLCSKFSVAFPYFSYIPYAADSHDRENGVPSEEHNLDTGSRGNKPLAVRDQGAAPPIYLVIIAFVPWAVAFFIASTRWFDHRHHGFDIIFGSLMGIVFGSVGFLFYNMPIRRGAGWSWGPRSRRHAFFKGVGWPSHVGADNWACPTGTEIWRPGMDTESASARSMV